MYLQGIAAINPARVTYRKNAGLGFWDEDVVDGTLTQDAPIPASAGAGYSWDMPSASGVFDWSGLLNTAVNAWGKVETLETQKEIEIARLNAQRYAPQYPAQYRYPSTSQPYPGQPGLSPFPGSPGYGGGTLFGMSMTTIMILSGVGIGAYFLLSNR